MQDDQPQKSRGHICFVWDTTEFYQVGQDVYRAPISAPIADAVHNTRIGRWECSIGHWQKYRDIITSLSAK